MNKSRWKNYLGSILIPLLLGTAVALLTMGSMERYGALRQPALAPPDWLFAPVWSLLYFLMGLTLAQIRERQHPRREDALFLFALQLFVNLLWPILFFVWELRLAAFFVLLLLIALVIAMIVNFWRIRVLSGALNLPYLIWLGYAAWLNLAVYLLNR